MQIQLMWIYRSYRVYNSYLCMSAGVSECLKYLNEIAYGVMTHSLSDRRSRYIEIEVVVLWMFNIRSPPSRIYNIK